MHSQIAEGAERRFVYAVFRITHPPTGIYHIASTDTAQLFVQRFKAVRLRARSKDPVWEDIYLVGSKKDHE